MNNFKALHTADWHIGKKIGNFSRLEEQSEFFEFLLQIIELEEISLLLIAGDIYDTNKPTPKEQKLLNDFFYKLSFTVCKWCVIISGNHDTKDYLNINRKILSKLNFFVITEYDSKSQVLYLKDKATSEIKCIVFCMPYINEKILIEQELQIFNFQDEVAFLKSFKEAYKLRLDSLCNNVEFEYGNIPTILLAHAYFYAGQVTQNRGNSSYILPVSLLKNRFSYVALGHLHQFIKFQNNIVYSGSPLRYSFNESDKKYLNILCFEDNILRNQNVILVPNFRNLIFISGNFDQVYAQIKTLRCEKKLKTFIKIELNEYIKIELEEKLFHVAKQNFLSIIELSYLIQNFEQQNTSIETGLDSIYETLKKDERYFFEEKFRYDLLKFSSSSVLRQYSFEELSSLFDEVVKNGESKKYEDK